MSLQACVLPVIFLGAVCAWGQVHSTDYVETQKRLAQGWNTWNPQSVLSQVLLPEGLEVRVELRKQELSDERTLEYAQIGRRDKDAEVVRPADHAVDGSYTDVTVIWQGMTVRVQSATVQGNLLLLLTPVKQGQYPIRISLAAGMLWNRPGNLRFAGDHIEAQLPDRSIPIYSTSAPIPDPDIPSAGPYLSFQLYEPAGISSGRKYSLAEIQSLIAKQKEKHEEDLAAGGRNAEVARAVEAAVGWNTIYDPTQNRVMTALDRSWDVGWGGYALGEWDTFFASYMAAEFSRDLAYADSIEMLNEMTSGGFVPNFARPIGWRSQDRSEPPVDALVALHLYETFHDRWFLQAEFPSLLRWNRWWQQNRVQDGYLVWGSDPVPLSQLPFYVSDPSIDALQGAKFESGLDNLCMWDGATFDTQTHHMLLGDVGLMGLYVADSDALARIANILGYRSEASELSSRADNYRTKLKDMWSEQAGMFLDQNLQTGKPWPKFSPTAFYPLLAHAATQQQAERTVREHLLNPREFWGDWVIPACPHNAPGFQDQDYWRGRIWGPMNFLVYLSLRNYDLPNVRHELSAKSQALLMKEWNEKGHIHENYNGNNGEGDDVWNSGRFYHWGALLGLISLIESKDAGTPAGK